MTPSKFSEHEIWLRCTAIEAPDAMAAETILLDALDEVPSEIYVARHPDAITDEMVTAALSAYHQIVDEGAYEPDEAMRAALEAALRS